MHLLPGWHPLVVHFPLALIVTAAVALSLSRLVRGARLAESLAVTGTWNLCVGAVAVFVALGTGLAAAVDLQVDPAARLAIAAHVKSAAVTAVLIVLTAVWRGAGNEAGSRPSRIFIVLLWAATAAAVVTGYRGAENVYQYGVGVRSSP